MKKKILILCNKDSGIYDFRKELLIRLVEEGYEVIVSVPKGNCISNIERLGCIVEITEFSRRGMNPVEDFKLLLTYVKLMKKYNPVIALTYTIKPNVYGNLACRIMKMPSIANITGLGTTIHSGSFIGRITLMLYRVGLKKVECVFFQNRSNYSFMKEKKCVKDNYEIISGSGVNLVENSFEDYPSEQNGIFVLSVMRIMKDKGIEELLSVIEKWESKEKVCFRLIGDYEQETKEIYEPWIQKLQKQGKLEYYGYRDDSHEFMKNAHVIVHPSYHEGMSNVLLEAAATGRMVIASDIPGCRETFKDNITGIAIKTRSIESLESALHRAINMHESERKKMGCSGRMWVEENFDREKVVTCYIKKIKEYEKC